MKVILLQDVKNLGKEGDVIEANDGFARNVIIKKGQGIEATGKNLNDLRLKKANDDKMAAELLEECKQLAATLEAGEIKVSIKTGEGGRAFGSVSSKEIAEEVKKQMNLDVDKKKVQLKDALKTLGTHTVPIKVHPKVTAQLKVVVSEAK